MIIYCSNKPEKFLGQINPGFLEITSSFLGDWNGHLFTIDRKKCLMFMNNKTCYSVILTNVYKRDLKDFGQLFTERLIRQLDHDLGINEAREIKLRQQVGSIIFRKSNNDRKIIGTINHHIENLKFNGYHDSVEYWDEAEVAGHLNNYLVGTKLETNIRRNRNFFRPLELMEELIR